MRVSRKLAVVAAFLAVAMLAGIAFAVWTATGTGSGSAKALTSATVTVNAVTGAADLYPGGPAASVHFTLTNTNPYAVSFDTVTAASVAGVSGGIGGSPACATTDLTVSTLPLTGFTPVTVDPETTSATQSIPGVVAMNSSAPNACQGAVFAVSLTLTGTQA